MDTNSELLNKRIEESLKARPDIGGNRPRETSQRTRIAVQTQD